MNILDKYITMAKEMGADNAVEVGIDAIAFDTRVILKCIFGCNTYGKNHTCPYQKSPLSMDEYQKIFERYNKVIVIGCMDKNLSQKISYEIERACFLDGYYFAFSLSDCAICKECAKVTGADCNAPMRARPAFHAVGIDVFKTVHGLGLPLDVLQNHEDTARWYSAVFVE